MKFEPTALAALKRVTGVFAVRPIVRNQPLSLREGRNGPQLVQADGERVHVVAVADDKPSLLSFAAINGFPVRNYTDMVKTTAREVEPTPKAAVPVLDFSL